MNLIDKSKNHEDTYFKAGDELRESNNVSIHPEQRIWRVSESDPDRGTNNRQQQHQQQQQQQQPGRQQNNGRRQVTKIPDFFQDNQAIKRKKVGKQYTTTRIKSRNFLSNISYAGISKENFYN